MSEAKFTKEEWMIDGDDFIYALNEEMVNQFSCRIEGNFKYGASDEEIKANANLMKTSPKMYEMLSKLSSMMTDINAHTVANEIESLLAEARGE